MKDWAAYGIVNNNSTQNMPTMEELLAITEKFKAINREYLRGESAMVETFRCGICGRGVTVTAAGFGKTYVVCRHVYDELKKLPKPDPVTQPPSAVDPPVSLHGVRIEVFDDGDKRW